MPHRVAWPWVTWHLWALIIVSKRKLMRLLAKGRPIKVKNKVLAVLPIPQDLALETDEAHTLARLREFPLKIYGQYFPLPSRQVAIKTLQLIQVSKLFLTVLVWICFCARTNIPAATARCYSGAGTWRFVERWRQLSVEDNSIIVENWSTLAYVWYSQNITVVKVVSYFY